MMNLARRKITSMALAIFCLLAMIGDCQAAHEEQTDGNDLDQAQMFPEAPLILNDNTLEEAIKIYPYLVLDCWETGCPPCKLIDPKIDRMAEDFKGRIIFAKLCIDNNPTTIKKYGISRTPTLLLFKNGTVVAMQVGNYPLEDLKRMILAAFRLQ